MKAAKMAMALFVSAFVTLTAATHRIASADVFPVPDVITPNVAFWTKVYALYTTGQGIVHDSDDLQLIYDVIDLIPYTVPDAEEINHQRVKQAVEEYESVLRRLARDPDASDETCRRVAALFKESGDSNRFARAAGRVRCQIGQRDRFQAGLIRSGAYIERIRTIFQSRELPEDLAYLPHVESSFNPNAYSKFGASGIWQFTRSTGRRFMNVGYVLDERRDPILSTYAAADLLKENFEKLGSWPLAITAYNHGAAGMERASQKYGDYAHIYQHYRSRTFKFASRNFYAEFLAARQIASDYEAYFGGLALDHPLAIRTVALKGFASFSDLSSHFNVDPQTLKQMNPALRQPVFKGKKYVPKGYALRLPAGIETELAAVPDGLYQGRQKPSRFYTVQPGDTASLVAQRCSVNLHDLILANNLDRRATIYPQQTLRIPGVGETAAVVAMASAAKTEPNEPDRPEVIQTGGPAAPAIGSDSDRTPAPGQPPQFPRPVLASIIPLPKEVPSSGPEDGPGATDQLQARNEQIVSADIGFERMTEEMGHKIGIIRVDVEETLGHYAEWAGVRTQQIRNLNGLRYGSMLRLHQKIKIPLNRMDAETFEQNRYEYHKRLQEDFFAVYRIGDLQPYRVRRGDNYWGLCRDKFQIPMWLLKHANPEIDLADLRIGRKLMIPVVEKASSTDAPGVDDDLDQESADPSTENAADSDSGSAEPAALQPEAGV
jgi:peptidoglycan lytic transglycosylase D